MIQMIFSKDGDPSFDKDTDGDGEGDQKMGGSLGQLAQDYVIEEVQKQKMFGVE